MKKLFLSLFVAGALTFTLQSCGSDDLCEGVTCVANETCVDGDCIPDGTATCEPCGTYIGTADGTIAIVPLNSDTTFIGLPVGAEITKNAAASSYNMTVDISSIQGLPAGSIVTEVDGDLVGQTLTIPTQTFMYQGAIPIELEGNVTFDATFDNFTGLLNLGNQAVGNATFSGTKQ